MNPQPAPIAQHMHILFTASQKGVNSLSYYWSWPSGSKKMIYITTAQQIGSSLIGFSIISSSYSATVYYTLNQIEVIHSLDF